MRRSSDQAQATRSAFSQPFLASSQPEASSCVELASVRSRCADDQSAREHRAVPRHSLRDGSLRGRDQSVGLIVGTWDPSLDTSSVAIPATKRARMPSMDGGAVGAI